LVRVTRTEYRTENLLTLAFGSSYLGTVMPNNLPFQTGRSQQRAPGPVGV
jgi:hypothetical protein